MKLYLYMELSLDGFIATLHDDVSWISNEAWQSYTQMMKKMDAIIIGKRTYELMPAEEFQQDINYFVVTNHKPTKNKVENIFFLDSTKEIMKMLNEKKYKNVCISGGGKTNASFMKEGLIDEIYVDVEPVILGKGIHMFEQSDFSFKLKLLETKKLNQSTIQLHYKVIK